MESVASNSSPSHHHRFKPTQPISDRIFRAIRNHLRLLHRSGSDFFVLGATGNVYTVNLSSNPTCTCPDRITPCKHILFILIRVLGVSLDDTCLRRRTIRPCQLNRLLNTPTSPEALAGANLQEKFHQTRKGVPRPNVVIEEGTICPICLEEMEREVDDVVGCGTCRNVVHKKCLLKWKRSVGRRSASCVLCRARWRDTSKENYVNLAAYMTQDDMPEGGGGSVCGG